MVEVCSEVEIVGSFLWQCLLDQEVPFGMGNLRWSTQNWMILWRAQVQDSGVHDSLHQACGFGALPWNASWPPPTLTQAKCSSVCSLRRPPLPSNCGFPSSQMERQMSVNSSIMGMQGPNLSNPCASPQVQPMHSEAKMVSKSFSHPFVTAHVTVRSSSALLPNLS